MSSLLDRVGIPGGPFRPRSISEFFALQLARRLDDETNIRWYADLVESHPRDSVLRALTRTRKRANGFPLANRFKEEMRRFDPHS